MSSIKHHNRNIAYSEDEPPEKKLVSDGDILVKELYKKQTNTKINLAKQLQNTKEFEKPAEFVPLTSYTSGSSTLQDFQSIVDVSNEVEELKAAGLNNEDIILLFDSRKGDTDLFRKHRNYDKSLLQERVKSIQDKVKQHKDSKVTTHSVDSAGNRHRAEFCLSVKPNSVETKLLKFALNNEKQSNNTVPHPMDNIKEIEKDCFAHITQQCALPLSKIRKKARSLANKIQEAGIIWNPEPPAATSNLSLSSNSQWDLKTCQEPVTEAVKNYTCKLQKLYTIKHGTIVEINKDKNGTSSRVTGDKLEQVSLEELKLMPKFQNYDAGIPSKVLYLKNLHKKLQEKDLRTSIHLITDHQFSIKLLSGRMSGLAFVSFQMEMDWKKGLEMVQPPFTNGGVYIMGKSEHGRLRRSWYESVRKSMKDEDMEEDDAQDRNRWRLDIGAWPRVYP